MLTRNHRADLLILSSHGPSVSPTSLHCNPPARAAAVDAARVTPLCCSAALSDKEGRLPSLLTTGIFNVVPVGVVLLSACPLTPLPPKYLFRLCFQNGG